MCVPQIFGLLSSTHVPAPSSSLSVRHYSSFFFLIFFPLTLCILPLTIVCLSFSFHPHVSLSSSVCPLALPMFSVSRSLSLCLSPSLPFAPYYFILFPPLFLSSASGGTATFSSLPKLSRSRFKIIQLPTASNPALPRHRRRPRGDLRA